MKPVITAIILSCVASAASAGSDKAAAFDQLDVTSAETWAGGYAGFQFGKDDITLSSPGSSESLDIAGYGLHVGYMHDLGNVVVGGEFDYNALTSDEVEGTSNLWRLRGRVGYDWNRFLPYVSIGVAHISDGPDLSETGFSYGLGADFKVTEKFTIGAEINRQSFNVSGDDGDDLDADLDLIQLRGSLQF